MYIVLHCGGMAFNGNTIFARSLGGSETAAYYIAKELVALGHNVSLFTNHPEGGIFDGVTYCYSGEPTKEAPLGANFHMYAENTPHDVLIIQRNPDAFNKRFASKVNLWWVHDLALGRVRPMVESQMWNVDGVLTVSEWHSKQVKEVYDFDSDIVYNIINAVDKELFNIPEEDMVELPTIIGKKDGEKEVRLFYSSRPERGLENLLKPGGVMDKLKEDKSCRYTLYFCGYDHTTEQTQGYYEHLYRMAEARDDSINLGALTKHELAMAMLQCDIHAYPSVFEETSCITAMEALAADLRFVGCRVGALPETTKDMPNASLVKLKKGGGNTTNHTTGVVGIMDYELDLNLFATRIIKVAGELDSKDSAEQVRYHTNRESTLGFYSWQNAARKVSGVIEDIFSKSNANRAGLFSSAREFVRNSDIAVLDKEYNMVGAGVNNAAPLIDHLVQHEIKPCYKFYYEDTFQEHYDNYYQYEKDRGVVYGSEDLSRNPRFASVCDTIANMKLEEGAVVLDYGCAHGHYSINLAKEFPQYRFVGVDIAQSNIDAANKWLEEEQLENVSFICGNTLSENQFDLPASIALVGISLTIVAEVLEHVANPKELIDSLRKGAAYKSKFLLTTPYGPWEAQDYELHWPWRAHLHHFEKQDINDLFGGFKDLLVRSVASGPSKYGTALGSLITSFEDSEDSQVGQIDYARKVGMQVPRQTVSLCMLAKDCEHTIIKTIKSVEGVVDEVIIMVDKTTQDNTFEVIEDYFDNRSTCWPMLKVFVGPSPLEVGFSAARNLTLERAECDWVLMLDSDESLVHPQNIHKYLKNNQYVGYAISQKHLSIEPAGMIKEDFPTRLFRNNREVQYFGVIHEHPETGINEGPGKCCVVHDVCISHIGYETEEIRQGRFLRNIGLMVRDREENPERTLGKFLWIRDTSQMCQFELQRTGGQISSTMVERAQMGLECWTSLLKTTEQEIKNKEPISGLRYLLESIEYYSNLNVVLGIGFDCAFNVDLTKGRGGSELRAQHEIKGRFSSIEHIQKILKLVTQDKANFYEQKYF